MHSCTSPLKAGTYHPHPLRSLVAARSAGMLDHLKVEVYGDSMPMKACGMATVRDPQLLVFNVFDPQVGEGSSLGDCEGVWRS